MDQSKSNSTMIQVEQFYLEIIQFCETRINLLENNESFQALSQIPEDSSFDFSINELSAQKLIELKSQMESCFDKHLLNALRDEFKRQLRLQAPPKPPPSQVPPTAPPPVHHFYLSKIKSKDGKEEIWKYWHFDGSIIARELSISSGHPSTLYLAGRDDPGEMCQWNLEEALIAEDLGEEIKESEFNIAWYESGGYPYVKANRKFRRFLTSAFKKP